MLILKNKVKLFVEFRVGNLKEVGILKQNQEMSVEKVSLLNKKRVGSRFYARKALNDFHLNREFNVERFSYQDIVEPMEIIAEFCNSVRSCGSIEEVYEQMHNSAVKVGYNFTAICLSDSNNEKLTVKLTDFTQNVFSFNQSFDEPENILVKSFRDNVRRFSNNAGFLRVSHLEDLQCTIIPLVSQNQSKGVFVAGGNSRNYKNDETINIICNYAALLMENHFLSEKLCTAIDMDSLTGLNTHRKLQEKLSQAIKIAEQDKENVSVIMFDINNISKINREFGHAKGDKIISTIANVIKNNIREADIAGRYGGDEIAIILPDTNNLNACFMAKCIKDKLSKCYIDGIGTIKTSIGIATYPNCTQNQERLLILAEQSMLISKHNGYKTGDFDVVSAEEVDFWDDVALNTLARVIAKRHSQWGFNFEDELVKRFIKAKKLPKIPLDVVSSLAGAIDAKDTYTRGHSQAVSCYAEALARAINLSEKKIQRIKLAALLHDVGKIGIAEHILRKPGALTDHEWEIMKQHPIIGVKKVLEPIKSLKDLIPIVRHHHERIDGYGYPDRLKDDEIPIGAKIVAIADAFHALISHRPYRKAMGLEKAVQILKSGAGTQWDRELVEIFISIAPSLCTEV